MRAWWCVLLLSGLAQAAPELPRPSYANSFCLFPINEAWHLRAPGDADKLRHWAAEMRALFGGPRLYVKLGVAVISDGDEHAMCTLTKELGLGLVFQGGAIEHHSVAWGFPKLFADPVKGDRRFAQWLQDGSLHAADAKADWTFAQRACASCYAKPVYELRKAYEQARARRLAKSFREFPDVVVAHSGPIECEMHQAGGLFGDYSPFTVAEFRDWLTHRGIYARGGERRGLGWPGGEVFADDPSPDRAKGDHPSFNATFGTAFGTWSLRYWDPEKFPERLAPAMPGLLAAGSKGFVEGGFDAPRVAPGQPPVAGVVAEGNDAFWAAWAGVDDTAPGFRSQLLNFWVRDHVHWLREAGLTREQVYSHQIPGESYGLGRLSAGASLMQTADTPEGSLGLTTYFGAAADAPLWAKLVKLNRNWGIFEYHPHPLDALHAPLAEYLTSLQTAIRFRAHILTPIAWNNTGSDFIVNTGPFAAAMQQVVNALPDQPYFNGSYVDYDPPAVHDVKVEHEGGAKPPAKHKGPPTKGKPTPKPPAKPAVTPEKTKVTWSLRIWPDLPYKWADWREFDHFEVRDAKGKVLDKGKDAAAELAGHHDGLKVVAVTKERTPKLPAVGGVTGRKGRLRWTETADFFCDHYEVQVFGAATAEKPTHTLTARQASLELRPEHGEKSVWVRVAAADGAGHRGPESGKFELTLDRPGRRLADLTVLRPRVVGSPDCAPKPTTVGGVTEPSLFEHPPLTGGDWARAEYSLSLPAVAAGQRLLFLADLGLKDGADLSDGVTFRVEVDGENLAEQLVKPARAWQPLEVDLSARAGKTVTLALLTNAGASSAGDWAAWGDAQVLLTGRGVNERPRVLNILADGKTQRGRVVLRWSDKASDGSLWSQAKGFAAFRIYRGAERSFGPTPGALLGESPTRDFTDTRFDGSQTFYRVTARFADGSESPASEPVQYAP